MHYYKKSIGDYHKKAGRLSLLQHGAYTLLMDACYDRERFPTEVEAIDWLWASSSEEIEAIRFVLAKFFVLEGDKYIQPRIEREIEDYQAKAKTNQRIARDREEKRRNKRLSSTNREQDVNESTTKRHLTKNQELLTNNQEPLINKESKTRSKLDWSGCLELTVEHIDIILANRKKKRAANSQRAINAILKQINKTLCEGYSIEQVVDLIAEKGWQTYKHDWFINSNQSFGNQVGIESNSTIDVLKEIYNEQQPISNEGNGEIVGNVPARRIPIQG